MKHLDSVRLLTIVLFLVFAANGATVPIQSLYLESLGASYAQISLILTTYAIVLMAANYGWGRLSDRLGKRKPVVLTGLLGMSLAFTLMALAPSYPFAWGARVVEGLAMAAYATTSLALLGDLLDNSSARGRRMGSYRGFASLSFALGAFGAGPTIDYLGMRQVYMVGAGLFFLAGLTALSIREPGPSPLEQPQSVPAKLHAQPGLPLAFLAGVMLWSCAFWAAYSMFPNYLVYLGYPKSTASWLGGLAALTEVPFMSAAGMMADWLGRVPILMAGGLGMGLVLIGYLFFNKWLIGLIGLQAFRGLPYSASIATSMIYATETGPAKTRAGTIGVYRTAYGIGEIVGLAAGGQIVQYTGFQVLFLISTAIFLCSSLLFWFLRGRKPVSHPLSASHPQP